MLRLIEGIEILQAAKNLPLQVQTLQWVPIKDEFGQDGFSPKIGTSDMPTSHLRSRLEWLRGDILHCTTQLKTLLQEV